MRQPRRSPLKLSLLSSAIAFAASAAAQQAYAVELCAGQASVSVTTAAPGDSCVIDTTNANVQIQAAASLTQGVDVQADGVTLANAGSVYDNRTAINFSTGGLSGHFTNSGDIEVSSYSSSGITVRGARVSGDISGTFSNSGNIDVQGSVSSSNANAYGVSVGGGVSGTLKNSGSIGVEADGSAYAQAVGIVVSADVAAGGRVTNAGTISADAYAWSGTAYATGIYVDGQTDGEILNTGVINVESSTGSSSAYAYGIKTGDLDADALVENSGRINATVMGTMSGYAYGIYVGEVFDNASVRNSGTINVLAAGATSSNSAYGIRVSSIDSSTASVVNSGTVNATAESGSDSAGAFGISVSNVTAGVVRNDGTVTASVSGDDSAFLYAYGMSAFLLTGDSSMTNTGVIRAEATGTGSGSGNASAWGLQIMYVQGNSELSNSGRVTVSAAANDNATAYAMHAYSAMQDAARLSNSGSLVASAVSHGDDANAYGMKANSMAGTTAISNTGDVDVSARADSGYGYAVGLGVDNGMADASRIDNSGTVSVSVSGATAAASGLWVEGTTADGAAIVNTGRVSVAADAGSGGAYAYGWGARTLLGTLANDGVLDVRASGPSDATADGLWLATGDGGVLRNTGSISAVASGAATVNAHGIFTEDSTNGTTVSNSGSLLVRASATGGSAEALAYGIHARTVDGTSSISNSGVVDVEASAANGTASAYGLYVSGTVASGATLSNSGTLRARQSGSGDAFGLMVAAANSTGVVVDNSGLIDGGVSLNGGTTGGMMICVPMGTGPCMPIIMPGVAGTISLTNSGAIVTGAGTQSRVDGAYTQAAGAALGFRVASSSDFGSLTVRDSADFSAGAEVRVLVEAVNQLQDGDTLANVISAGSLTLPASAAFTVTDNSLFWNFDSTVDGNTLDLNVNFGGAAAGLAGSGQAFTTTQLAFVDQLLQGGLGGDFSELAEALNGTPDAAAAADVLESVGPVLAGAATTAMRSAGQGASNAISARLGETRGAASGDAFTQNTLWIKPFLGKATQDSVSGVDGYDVDSTGFVIGLDGDVTDAWRVGVAVASSQSDVEGDKAELDVKSTQFTLYGSYALSDTAALDLNLDHVSTGVDGTRRVALVNSTARSSYDGSQFAFGATLSNRVAMGEHAFIPALQARFQRVSLDGYTETGAGVYDLTVQSSNESSLLWAAEGAFEFAVGKGTLLANAGLGYDSLDATSLTATLNGGSGPTFVSNGIKPDSTVVTGGVGYRYVTAKALEINVAYDLESRGDFEAQTASVKFKLPF
ncbi:MAG: outer rane autotransporter [Moraxellaceae bacterium]|jgi:hypothetical protein|nr:outer rane autotransporter [Moraxellaceae bacterium]